MGNWSPFRVDHSKKPCSSNKLLLESKAVGLKILAAIAIQHQTHNHRGFSSNSKQIKSNKPTIFQRNQIPPSSYYNSCFLKSCFLCHKNLFPNKDVYMYRGDQGFCSEECRSRQMYIDEMKELEISTKKMVKRYRQSHGGGRCDHRRHNPMTSRHPDPVVFS